MQHVKHVCTPSETALAMVQLRRDARHNSGVDHVLQHKKQHDATVMGRFLLGTEWSPDLKTGTIIPREAEIEEVQQC